MPHLELRPDGREKRRSIVDAMDALRQRAAFDGEHTVKIRTGGLRLPSQDIVGLVVVVAENAAGETIDMIPLPACEIIRAKRQGSDKCEEFSVFRFDGATVDGCGVVELTDGTRLRAAEVEPALLFHKVTDLDWRIVHTTIAFIHAGHECYRSPTPESPPLLDCSRLPSLDSRCGLKQIQGYIADQMPALAPPSQQQIANSLRKFGMRIPLERPRRGGAATS
ncbi:hypothetical protein GPL17_30625 [Bradyrhizobium yuanmingense]|uniref:hypothetical protein n=1 Tax=Bradyrhizobium yuanmingense TaxID=108015 RepID=UPI0012FC40DF|nr:hypothetical protein [Bradyrhizobium yuanmingense]MVT54804.1 hypothetical protein [Bradyrhizobium yuanmingense]